MSSPIRKRNLSGWFKRGFRESRHEKDDSTSFYPEDIFREKIAVERKRTERSGRPFLLLLIHLERLVGRRGSGVLPELVSGVDSLIRETDVAGWYAYRSVIGVLFTEIGENHRDVVRERIRGKVVAYLSGILSTAEIPEVEIAFHFFPDEKHGLFFYPFLSGDRKFHRLVKRMKDVAGSLIALAVFSPFFLVIPILVKLSSRGPVLFAQERLGEHGEIFSFLKFRTMYADCSHQAHREYVADLIRNGCACGEGAEKNGVRKMTDDPRITPIGRVLRKTSLDELPQFINVLKGEMSIVGPRPPIPYEFENYGLWHRRRVMEVKPGITGLWQVRGRSLCSFDEMVRLDLKYINNWSLWLDFKIILQTPWVMITGKGAY